MVYTNLTDLANYLRGQAQGGGQITLDCMSDRVTQLIQSSLGITGSLIVTGVDPNAIPQNPGATLTITGTLPAATLQSFLNLTNNAVQLVFTVLTGGDAEIDFTLRVQLANDWTLSKSFDDLIGIDFSQFPVDTSNGQFLLFTSYPDTPSQFWSANNPFQDDKVTPGITLVEGLNYYAHLAITNPASNIFSTALTLLSGFVTTPYQLYGPIALGTEGTTLDVAAPITDASVSPLGFIEVSRPSFGMQITRIQYTQEDSGENGSSTSVTTTTPEYYASRVYYFAVHVTIGTSGQIPLLISAGLLPAPENDFTVLTITADGQPGISIDDLGQLINTKGSEGQGLWDSLFSTSFAQYVRDTYLKTLVLKSFEADFQLGSGITNAVQYVQTKIGTTTPWPIVDDISFTFDVTWSINQPMNSAARTIGAFIDTTFTFKEKIQFEITASIPDMVFAGRYIGDPLTFRLSDLVDMVFGTGSGITVPDDLFEIELDSFNMLIDAGNKKYTFGAVFNASISLFGTQILALYDTSVQFSVSTPENKPKQVSAQINGTIAFGPIQLAASANLSKESMIIQMHLVNETLGSMLNHFAHLVDPNYDISFPSPWDKILDISLDALVLTLDLTKKTINLTYTTNIDLAFIKITGITLDYAWGNTAASNIAIGLDASFVGQPAQKMGWDPINEKPPAVPGGGGSLLDLKYLGIGQHIAFSDTSTLTTVEAVINKMIASVIPTDGKSLPPLGAGQNGLAFSKESGWLVGANFTVMDTVTLGIVFNDPNLYGLLISLAGARAKALAGLKFEILYRKITDSIGVYHIELQVPDAFRTLQFGEVSLTLPIIVLDIYTNGNFRVDLGFPKGLDFSNSFCLQVLPFIGYGGFYFALLDGDTSSRVPKIDNGNFSPVVEFGIGLSLGVGKTIDEGILSAGISVTVVGILQGVIAWFNPNDQSLSKEEYYWIQGTVAIVGKLYGSVDFGIIKVSVSVTAYASVTLVIEAHKPILISLDAGVSVRASVKVVFFTIHFSFSITIHASFTVGSASPTPWHLAPAAGAPALQAKRVAAFAQSTQMLRTSPSLGVADDELVYAAASIETTSSSSESAWSTENLGSGTPPTIHLYPVLGFTDSLDTGGAPNAILLLGLQNEISAEASGTDQLRASNSSTPRDNDFNRVLETMLNWAVTSYRNFRQEPTGSVSLQDLDDLRQLLQDPSVVETVFDYTNVLQPFLANNFVFDIQDPATVQSPTSVTVFPMLPPIRLTTQNGPAVDITFSELNKTVDQHYRDLIEAYFELLLVQYMQGVADDGSNTKSTNGVSGTDEPLISPATVMFEQYFAMLTTGAVKAAYDLLSSFTYDYNIDYLQADATTSSMPNGTPTPKPYGMGDIRDALNLPSLSASQIVSPNQKLQNILNAGAKLTIPNVTYQTGANDSFNSIASGFTMTNGAVTVQAIDIAKNNLATAGILNPATALTISGVTYTVQSGDTLALVATRLQLRAGSPDAIQTIPNVATYASTISAANPGKQAETPGTSITIPSLANAADTFSYTTVEGDTWLLIAAYFTALQTPVLNVSQLISQIMASNNLTNVAPTDPLTVATLAMPAVQVTVLASDSIASVASRMIATTDLIAPELLAVGLAPQAVLTMPEIEYTIQGTESLADIAARFDLAIDLLAPVIENTTDPFISGQALAISQIEEIELTVLFNALAYQGEWNNIAGMVSRFLLAGLRLPDPSDTNFTKLTVDQLQDPTIVAGIATKPVYLLTGQQFAIDAQPESTYTITLQLGESDSGSTEQSSEPQWIVFGSDGTAADLVISLDSDQTSYLSAISGTAFDPEVQWLDRLELFQMVPPRYTLQTHLTWQASVPPTFTCSATTQLTGGPSLWLFPDGLVEHLEELAGKTGAPDSPIANTPTLASKYELVVGTQTDATQPMSVSDVACYAWGTILDLTVTVPPVDGTTPAAITNSYVMVGADDVGRDLLYQLYEYLTNTNPHDTPTLYLVYSSSPTSATPTGIISDALDPNRTFLLKTNLSTMSNSGNQPTTAVATSGTTEIYSAALADPLNFIKLLWECSVVRSGGYYLNYMNTNGDAALPGTLFTDGKSATISLLVVLESQRSTAYPPVYSFNNCAAIGDNIDIGTSNVFFQPVIHVVQTGETLTTITNTYNATFGGSMTVRDLAMTNASVPLLLAINAPLTINAPSPIKVSVPYNIEYGDTLASIAAAYTVSGTIDDLLATSNLATAPILALGAQMQFAPGILQPQATVPQGNVGFEMARTNPDPNNIPFDQLAPADKVRTLFQLLGYSIAQSGPASAPTFYKSGEGLPVGPADSSQDSGNGVSGEGMTDDTLWNYKQVVAVAPFATSFPGSSSPALPARAKNPYAGIAAKQTVDLNFVAHDIYGNTQNLGSDGGVDNTSRTIPVGYYTDIIALNRWPSIGLAYQVTNPTAPQLEIDLTMHLEKYFPSPSITAASALAAVQGDLATYAQIYYQLQQPDLTFAVETSLANDTNGTPINFPISPAAPFHTFANSAYAFFNAAAGMTAYVQKGNGTTTIGDLVSTFGVTAGQLLTTNQTQLYSDLFGTTLFAMPLLYIVVQGDTLTAIAARSEFSSYGLDPQKLGEQNTTVALNEGIAISTPARSYTTHDGYNLLRISQEALCSIAGIATANHGTPNILKAGTTLTVNSTSYQIVAGDTFDSVVTAFAALNVTVGVGDLATANQGVNGIFVDGATLNITDVVTVQGDTLATLTARYASSGFTVDALATGNASLANLFANGTPLYIGMSSNAPISDPTWTLQEFAANNSITIDNLALHNTGIAFASNAEITIPCLVTATGTGTYAPYSVVTGTDTLTTVAAKYSGATATSIAQLNSDVQGIIAGSLPITIGGVEVTTGDSDTFDSIIAAFGAKGKTITLGDLVGAVGTNSALFTQGAVLLTPPMVAANPGTGDGTTNTLNGLAARYNLDPLSLALANGALLGFLAANVDVTYDTANPIATTVKTGAYDTLYSLINRFAAIGITTTLDDLVTKLGGVSGLLNPASFVVPLPAATSYSLTLKGAIPKTPIFALTVEVIMSRDPDFIDPDFAGVETVRTARVSITPYSDSDSSSSSSLSLQHFATDFEKVLPGLHVATGEAGTSDEPAAPQKIWAVNLDNVTPPTIAGYDITGTAAKYSFDSLGARYFAVPPLATTLQSGPAQIRQYVSGTGLTGDGETTNFQAVDLDVWAQAFLDAVDLFLSPSYAVPAYEVSADPNNPTNPLHQAYNDVVTQKGVLADAISQRVIDIIAADSADGSRLEDAQETLRQSLLVSLSNTYSISTIVQVPAAIDSPYSGDGAPRLSGKPSITLIGDNNYEAVEDYSLSTAKVDLAKGESYATFLFTVKSPAESRRAVLGVDYVVNEVEVPTGDTQIDGYEETNWLTLVNPIVDAQPNIGTLTIPIPLRSYPSPISLNEQSGTKSKTSPTQPSDLVLWSYGFTYQHIEAEQDTTYLNLQFNVGSTALYTSTPEDVTLFQALAQFMAVYPKLKADLALLPALKPGTTSATVTAAVGAFRDLVAMVAAAWGQWPMMSADGSAPLPGLNYSVKSNWTTTEMTVTVTALSDGTALWPDVYLVVNDTPVQLTADAPVGSSRLYHFTGGTAPAPGTSLTYQFVFPDLLLTTTQNGWAGVYVKRNENLLDDGGGSTGQTAAAFIYQTPIVRFSNLLTPFLYWPDEVTLAPGSGGSGTVPADQMKLAGALATFFDGLFGSDGTTRRMRIAGNYGYQLAASGELNVPVATTIDDSDTVDSLVTVPVTLVPSYDFNPAVDTDTSSADSFVRQMAKAMYDWKTAAAPTTSGAFLFDLSLFSSLASSGQAASLQPILETPHILYVLD